MIPSVAVVSVTVLVTVAEGTDLWTLPVPRAMLEIGERDTWERGKQILILTSDL